MHQKIFKLVMKEVKWSKSYRHNTEPASDEAEPLRTRSAQFADVDDGGLTPGDGGATHH